MMKLTQWIGAIALAAAPLHASAVLGLIYCGVPGATTCNAKTFGHVAVYEKVSRAPCTKNKTYTYDNDSIRTFKGCQALFVYGQNYLGNNSDPAIAEIYKHLPPPPGPVYMPASPYAEKPSADIVGGYMAFDPEVGKVLLLFISSDGTVAIRNDVGKDLYIGTYDKRAITWQDGKKTYIVKESDGLSLGIENLPTQLRFR